METAVREKRNIEAAVSRVYLWLMLLGLPMVIRDGYFDITEVKTVWFAGWSVLFLLFRGAMALQHGAEPSPPRAGDLFALALCVLTLFSSIMSGFFTESFLGTRGRWQGTGMIWIYAALFFAMPEKEIRERDVFLPLGAGLAVTGTLAVLQHLGWDVLGLSAELTAFDRGRYISTLGNINFAGAYLTLAVPVTLWRLLNAERGLRQALLTGLALLGLWACMAVRSECTVLGIGAALVLMPFLLRGRAAALRRWALLWPGMAAGMQVYGLLIGWRGARFSALTRLLLHPAVSAVLAVIGLLVWLLLRKQGENADRSAVGVYGGMLLAALLLGAAALTLLNTVWKSVPLGSMGTWLHFSDSWGTDRVKVWRYCLGLYRSFPLPDKLLGGGCGVLARLDVTRRIFPDAILDAAHSEYLQILLNWGALGLIAWLGWLGFTFRDILRQGESAPLALLAGLLGYAVQAAVNIAQTPGIALFFLLLAMAGRKSDSCGH